MLTALAPRLPGDTLCGRAGVRRADRRSRRVVPISTGPRAVPDRAVAEDRARGIRPDSRDVAERLAPLADRFPGPLLLDALAAVREIEDDTARVAALAVLVPHLPEPQADEATAAVRTWLTTTAAADGAWPASRSPLWPGICRCR